jgi:hypothetical protein
MIPCVIAYRMPFRFQALEDGRVVHRVLPYAEKGGLHPQLQQRVQYPRRYFRYRAVVECQVHVLLLVRTPHVPKHATIELLQPAHGFGYYTQAHAFLGR